jgi:hypothetical protein
MGVSRGSVGGFSGEFVADHLARFGDAKTGEPEQRMLGDRESDEFVEEIFCEVAAAHVREFVGKLGVEVFVGEICK